MEAAVEAAAEVLVEIAVELEPLKNLTMTVNIGG